MEQQTNPHENDAHIIEERIVAKKDDGPQANPDTGSKFTPTSSSQTDVKDQTPSQPRLFTKDQRALLSATLVIFGVSMAASFLTSIFPQIFRDLGPTVSYVGWSLGTLVGLIAIVGSFAQGVTRIIKDKGATLLGAVLIALIILLVGGGSCFFNFAMILS